MGYTTTFNGSFKLNKRLSAAHCALLEKLEREDFSDEDWAEYPSWTPHPDHYFLWCPTKDRMGIQWNGGEKFRGYVEWLQWLIDKVLVPWGYELSGEIEYHGEDHSDWGVLKIVKGKVVKEENPVKSWITHDVKLRESVIEAIESASGDFDFSTKQTKALAAAMKLLREGK